MKFSITIPAYKSDFLEECIKSVLAQTYEDFELIIVDDCSPNDLQSIICKFADSRIKFYRNETNCGAINVVDNWNICLSHAKGEYVICMGDDDMLAPTCLEDYVIMIGKYPQVNVFHTRVKQINENGDFIQLTDTRPEWESVYSLIWYRMAYRQQYIGDFLFKTSQLRTIGGYYKLPYAWASDDITVFLMAEKYGIVHVDKPNFFYRINDQTITSTGNALIKMNALLDTDKWLYNFIISQKPINDVDKCLQKMIIKGLSKYSILQKSKIIKSDLLNSFLNIFKWYKYRHKYQIKLSVLIFSVFEYLKSKYKRL